MLATKSGLTRRDFIKTTIAAVGAATLPFGSIVAQGSAKYTRYNVMSEDGKKALASYARGVEAMLKLPADHPQNWFRNAFIHLMDCPHGNWWFYVWHRGYLGYFEQTIRNLSGDDKFAIPYWDWTTLPQIPDSMFDGVLTPQSQAFEPYTRNLAVFTSFVQPALSAYWKTLNSAQLAQLKTRGYTSLDSLWNDVTGYDPTQKPPHGISGNMAYATPCGSRYLTRDNSKLDEKTAYDVSPFVVYAGLLPTDFYNQEAALSFNSSKTPSHNTQPGGKGTFFQCLRACRTIRSTTILAELACSIQGLMAIWPTTCHRWIQSSFSTTPTWIACGTCGRASRNASICLICPAARIWTRSQRSRSFFTSTAKAIMSARAMPASISTLRSSITTMNRALAKRSLVLAQG